MEKPRAGPLGRCQRLTPKGILVVLLLVTSATFAIGWAQKLPCRINGYGPANRYAYSRLCYTDVHVAWTSQRLSEGKLPYVDHPVEYPVLMGVLMAAAAAGAESATEFFDHTSALLLFAALVVTGTTAVLLGPARACDAALVALAPGMVLHGTVNWDLAAAAFAGLALVAWARRRPGFAGVMLGLGAAVKFYPALFLIPLLILCVRGRQLRAWARAAMAATSIWLICNGLTFAVAGSFAFGESGPPRNAVLRFFILNRDRPADWDSIWFVVQEIMKSLRNETQWAFSAPTVNVLSGALLAIGLAALVILLWKSPSIPRVGQAVFLATAVFLLTNKVFSPQYTIWLVPLAVIARPRWLPFLGWQVLEVVLTATRFWHFERLADPGSGLPIRFFMAAVIARDLALLALMYGVVHDIRHPEEDDVRVAHDSDPGGGLLSRRMTMAKAR
jgi:uncharacterized membrane protein